MEVSKKYLRGTDKEQPFHPCPGSDVLVAAKMAEEFVPLTFKTTAQVARDYVEAGKRQILVAPPTYLDMLRRFRAGLEEKQAEGAEGNSSSAHFPYDVSRMMSTC